jgi:hypothetical protein
MPGNSRREMSLEFYYDVFLSHSAKDKAVVRPLAERLRADALKLWFDEWELRSCSTLAGPKARNVTARPEGPGRQVHKHFRGLKGRKKIGTDIVPFGSPFQGFGQMAGTRTWGFTPGFHRTGFQPCRTKGKP